VLALGLLLPALAPAHELSLADLRLREVRPGEFLWNWGTGGLGRSPQDELAIRWPDGCSAQGDQLLCRQGLKGELAVTGIGDSYSATLLRVTWQDGQSRTYTLTQAQPALPMYGAADDQRGAGEVLRAYGVLGFEHILGGLDHLLFVACLLLVVGFGRPLVWTITAFTVAHSITLASSVLGLITLRSGPVEAVIALSIVLAASEALHRRATITRRWPALVAFAFGLVHGLGFAGALSEIGLPEAHVPLALLSFNVGVELGQLSMVGLLWLLGRLLDRLPAGARWALQARTPAVYAIGILAAFWSWQRASAVVLA
jgi:hypothetical protein